MAMWLYYWIITQNSEDVLIGEYHWQTLDRVKEGIRQEKIQLNLDTVHPLGFPFLGLIAQHSET